MCVCVNVVFRKVYAASPGSLVSPVSCCFVKYNPNDKFNIVGQIRQNDIVVCGKANLQIKKKPIKHLLSRWLSKCVLLAYIIF